MHPVESVNTMAQYLEKYGPILATQGSARLVPLHRPGIDPLPAGLADLSRPLYPAQAHVAAGAVKVLAKHKSAWLTADTGTGKCQRPHSKILTPSGWKYIGEIEVGDEVVNPAGETAKVVGVYPQGIKPFYRITFSDGASTECCDEHLWSVHTNTQKARGEPDRVLTLRTMIDKGLQRDDGSNRYYIPLATAPEFEASDLPLDPYLLGVILGDGCLASGRSIGLSNPEPEIIARVASLLPEGVELRRQGESIDYRITGERGAGNPFLETIRSLGLDGHKAETKFIPLAFRLGRSEDRLSLLRGLMDTDGTLNRDYGAEYSTASETLAGHVVELARSLGGTAKIAVRLPWYTYKGERRKGQPSYRIMVRLPNGINPFWLTRKASGYRPVGKYGPTRAVRSAESVGNDFGICIALDSDNQLYVTDDYVVTHNTAIGAALGRLISEAGKVSAARGRKSRVLVMCPDHLKKKWAREVGWTLPDVDVVIVKNWRDLWKLATSGELRRVKGGKRGWRWAKPQRDTWYIVGRDQAKLDPAWRPSYAVRYRWQEAGDGESGQSERRKVGVLCCPKCGAKILNRAKLPISLRELKTSKKTCKAETTTILPPIEAGKPPREVKRVCGEPLWQFLAPRKVSRRAQAAGFAGLASISSPPDRPHTGAKPYRWAPARLIQAKLHRLIDLFILDEAHEEKSADSAQGVASGKLAGASRKVLALTGSLVGGYAWHVFNLLWRLCPHIMVDEGYQWGKPMPFVERYGRVDEILVYPGEPRGERVDHTYSMGRQPGRERRLAIRPGIMPTLFGDMLMGQCLFLGLDEISDALPPRPKEEIFAIDMDANQRAGYQYLEAEIRRAIAPMIRNGDISLLSRMLHGLLGWTDFPGGWRESGYFEPFGFGNVPDLDPNKVYPKERAILEFVRGERDAGRQVWVCLQMTDQRDVAARLLRLFRSAGLNAGVLRPYIKRDDREEWIAVKGRELDVAISHPRLIETGLDLFVKEVGPNYCSIAFYQPGYNPFTLAQAGGRAWRIGQDKPCRTCYFYYRETMQDRAMALMARKLAAMASLQGRFTTEGLLSLIDDEAMELALARTLVTAIPSAEREWSRLPAPPSLGRLAETVADRARVEVSDTTRAMAKELPHILGGESRPWRLRRRPNRHQAIFNFGG